MKNSKHAIDKNNPQRLYIQFVYSIKRARNSSNKKKKKNPEKNACYCNDDRITSEKTPRAVISSIHSREREAPFHYPPTHTHTNTRTHLNNRANMYYI